MFTQPITKEQKEYAWELVQKENVAQRGRFDGNSAKQFIGALGEVCFADGMGISRPRWDKGFDKGIDFIIDGIKIDVKTMGRMTYPAFRYCNNIMASQTKYDTDLYVFASIHKKLWKITYLGALPKADLEDDWKGSTGALRTRSDGTQFALHVDTYEVPNKFVGSVKTFSCFRQHILWETL